MNRQMKIWLKYVNWIQYRWQDLLRWFQGTRYNPPRWAWRGTCRTFDDSEAFIQLYYELSKGGCKDFIEEVHFIVGDEEALMDDRHVERFSYLTFKHPTVIGNKNNLE